MRKGIVISRAEERLKALFDLFYERYTLRILPFMYRQIEFPSEEELYEMLQAERSPMEKVFVQGGDMKPQAQSIAEQLDIVHEIVRRVGGLANIQTTFQEYKKHNKLNFGILEDFCNVGQIPELPNTDAICAKRCMALKTIYDRKRIALYDIAAILERQRINKNRGVAKR